MAKYYTSGYMPPAGVTDAEQVKQIQQQLTQAGYNIGSTGADGIWGKNTQAAYESYLASSGKVQRPNTTPDWSSPVGAWGGSSSSFGVSLPSAPSYDIGAAYDKSAACLLPWIILPIRKDRRNAFTRRMWRHGKLVVLDISENGRQIGEKLFALLNEQQQGALAQLCA